MVAAAAPPRAAARARGGGRAPRRARARAAAAGAGFSDAGGAVAAGGVAASRRVDDLFEWAEALGGRVSKVRVEDCGARGDGLVAADDIPEGELVATIPRELALGVGGGCCRAAELIAQNVEDDDLWAVGLAAELMLLRARIGALDALAARPGQEDDANAPPAPADNAANAAAVFWAPYVTSLPAGAAGFPLYMDRKELAALQYPPVSAEVERRFEYLRQFMYDVVQPLAVASGALPPDGLKLDTLGWAFVTVSSRAMRVGAEAGSGGALMPVLDMANHSASPNARVRQSAVSGDYQLQATRAIAAGEEVTISYGDLSNDDLFLNHGFFVDGFDEEGTAAEEEPAASAPQPANPHDVVQIWLGLPLLEAGAAKARELGLAGAEALPQSVAQAAAEPWRAAALQALGVPARGAAASAVPARLGLGEAGDDKMLRAADAVAARSEAALADPSDAELAAAAALVSGMAAAVESCFGTTLEEDEGVVGAMRAGVARLSETQASAVRFRLSKKRLLRAYAEAHGAKVPRAGGPDLASGAVRMAAPPTAAAETPARRRRRSAQWPKVE